ncbi:MAG: UDP-N-acetylglucosamine 1-carboxyvinyltransferase [Candidatus Omnitrophica bacterium]|nr:UDP-N-acetylglucosamine 1-carboxyvinyltransferase [Candidatus Omnitrophota bacterium]MCM8827110.1 UDP-N-acetylglucosamine 1-carboxyvinyltransferase [Candidatus Omnitrophota bacterium]
MDKFVVYQSSLKGEVKVSGSKNATLPIMAATLLTDEECKIIGVPDLADVRTMIKILDILGKEVIFEGGVLIIKRKPKKWGYVAPYRLVRTMRASFCVLGPLLARRKKAKVSFPGGCIIGVRPVDLHIKGLRELGAQLNIERGYCVGEAKKLRGAHIFLGGAFGSSVLATDNTLMAATLAEGETTIEYAACEPEVVDLALFLKKMGADIEGEGTHLIRVRGVKSLGGAEFKVIPDRIEAGTFIAVALATGSSLTISGINPLHLTAVIETAKKIGANITVSDSKIHIDVFKKLSPTNITTLPYPGFPTDLQAQFMVALCLAEGISLVNEKIYPDRFMHVSELNRMGARIQRSGPYAIIEGNRNLVGAEVMASDLRASAALVIAGLVAKGKTEILRIYHLDRGYEKLDEKLKILGAKIKREKS